GTTLTFTLPETTEAAVYEIEIQDVSSDVLRELDEENVNTDQVAGIKLRSALVEIATSNVDFDFGDVANLSLSMRAPGLSEVIIALKDSDLSGNRITLEIEDRALLEYLLASTATYKLMVTTTAPLPEPIDLDVTPEFGVTARPL
ncbi:MAG: hypothetical protein AAF597_17575, partial [Bacteroidota bacterium]